MKYQAIFLKINTKIKFLALQEAIIWDSEFMRIVLSCRYLDKPHQLFKKKVK